MIEKLAFVALGGAIGAALRFLGVGWAVQIFGASHWGTLMVNVIGSALMGVLVVLLFERWPTDGAQAAPFLMTGVLGGFTTFSAFSLDAVRLLEEGQVVTAGLYVFGSVGLSIGGLVLGMIAARVLVV